jgi:hypothetical protein
MTHRLCGIGGWAAAGAVLALAAGRAIASAPALPAPEDSLLGVRLMATFRDVLKKYGEPQEIQVGGAHNVPTMNGPGTSQLSTRDAAMLARSIQQFAQGVASQPNITPQQAQQQGFQYGQQLAAQYGGGAFGGGAFGGGAFGGGGRFGGGSRLAQPGQARPAIAPQAPAASQAYSETTWWYNFPLLGLHFSFLFNKDGRVIQIQEYGWKMGRGCTPTRQGIGLGTPLAQIIRRYGWSDDGEKSGATMTLRYGSTQRLGFQLVRNSVAGITLAVGE